MPEIFINDEDMMESLKGNSSIRSLTRSIELSAYGRISQQNSKTF